MQTCLSWFASFSGFQVNPGFPVIYLQQFLYVGTTEDNINCAANCAGNPGCLGSCCQEIIAFIGREKI